MDYKINMDKGFSVIELMVVIAIIALLAAMAVSSYNSYQKRVLVTSLYNLTTSYESIIEQTYDTTSAFPPTQNFLTTGDCFINWSNTGGLGYGYLQLGGCTSQGLSASGNINEAIQLNVSPEIINGQWVWDSRCSGGGPDGVSFGIIQDYWPEGCH